MVINPSETMLFRPRAFSTVPPNRPDHEDDDNNNNNYDGYFHELKNLLMKTSPIKKWLEILKYKTIKSEGDWLTWNPIRYSPLL
jgi:hypothetical protein